jgi:hypothetical protein
VELKVMKTRLSSEMSLKEPIDDEYGMDSINSMIAEINAEYAAMDVNISVTRISTDDGTDGDEDEEEKSDNEPRTSKRYVDFTLNAGPFKPEHPRQIQAYLIHFIALLTPRRRVSTSTASQQQVNPYHWSRRVTADNPHGFVDKVLARLRAIEDPVKREKAERKVLADRRHGEKRRSDAEAAARNRDQAIERYRKRKVDAGYVMLVVVLMEHKHISYFVLPQLPCAHTYV